MPHESEAAEAKAKASDDERVQVTPRIARKTIYFSPKSLQRPPAKVQTTAPPKLHRNVPKCTTREPHSMAKAGHTVKQKGELPEFSFGKPVRAEDDALNALSFAGLVRLWADRR